MINKVNIKKIFILNFEKRNYLIYSLKLIGIFIIELIILFFLLIIFFSFSPVIKKYMIIPLNILIINCNLKIKEGFGSLSLNFDFYRFY